MSICATTTRTVVTTFLSHLPAANVEGIISLGAPGATWWISGIERKIPGAGKIPYAERAPSLKKITAMKDFKFTLGSLTVEEDRACIEAEVTATNEKGSLYENHLLVKLVVKDGLIQEVREYLDFGAAWEFLGSQAVQDVLDNN